MTILATCVRNEGPYLLEWIAYNKLIGFRKIIIYSNDNTDGSDQLLALLHDQGHIVWRPRIVPAGTSPQASAFEALSDELLRKPRGGLLAGIPQAERYLAWLDCDEYLYFRCPQTRTISDLLQRYAYPAGISINWKHFGSSNEKEYEPGLTITRFQRCAPKEFTLNKMLKTICKLDADLFPGVITQHRPCNRSKTARIVYATPDQSTEAVPSAFLDDGIFASDVPDAKIFHEVCHLNHYSVRSLREYHLKQSRGNGWDISNSGLQQYPDDYFSVRDRNEELDTTINDQFSAALEEAIASYDTEITNASQLIQDNLSATSKIR